MSSSTSTPNVAIFGSTGGSGLAVLRRCLQAGLRVNALVRTPSKLTSQFPSAKYPNLAIIQGDIRDLEAVKKTLTVTDGDSSKLVDIIVSGIGMVGFSDRTICEDGVNAIFAGVAEIQGKGSKAAGPRIVIISSTGISNTGRDIAIPMIPVYRTLVKIPHVDKRKMEANVLKSGARWCLVRPSHLTNGESKGLNSIKVGVEVVNKKGEAELVNREIGYSIRREDVALWIFEELIKGGGKGEWEGKIASLQY